MIDWDKSAKLNGMSVEELKLWFEGHPGSGKRVWRICDNCPDEREVSFYQYHSLCHKCGNRTLEHCKADSKAKIEYNSKPKSPLPQGQEIQIPENKNSSSYLGSIAEELLAKTYKDVKRMPYGNRGFDIICDRDYKIDVKSSAIGYTGGWYFTIFKNKIADFFLCVAFESRKDITPTHLWLIPGHILNRFKGVRISKSTLHKWSQYEQSLDRVLSCCNVMKGD